MCVCVCAECVVRIWCWALVTRGGLLLSLLLCLMRSSCAQGTCKEKFGRVRERERRSEWVKQKQQQVEKGRRRAMRRRKTKRERGCVCVRACVRVCVKKHRQGFSSLLHPHALPQHTQTHVSKEARRTARIGTFRRCDARARTSKA